MECKVNSGLTTTTLRPVKQQEACCQPVILVIALLCKQHRRLGRETDDE